MTDIKLCFACKEKVDADAITCGGCLNMYHVNKKCINYTPYGWSKLSQKKQEEWRCQTVCLQDIGNSQTLLQLQNVNLDESKKAASPNPPNESDMKALQKTIEELQRAMSFLSNDYDNLRKTATQQNKSIQVCTNRITELEKQNNYLYNEVEKLRYGLNQLDNYGRRFNLEIHNVEESQNEDVPEILENLAKVIKVQFKPSDIGVAHRLPKAPNSKSKRPAPLLVQFTRKDTRNNWMASKKKVDVISKNIKEGNSESPIYFNENLSPDTKKLFLEARYFAKLHGYHCWTSNGNVLVRKKTDIMSGKRPPAIPIRNIEMLQKLQSETKVYELQESPLKTSKTSNSYDSAASINTIRINSIQNPAEVNISTNTNPRISKQEKSNKSIVSSATKFINSLN